MRTEDTAQYLNDYLDDALEACARQELEAALAGSEPLRRELSQLRELRDATGRLPRSIEPRRDLWPEIADRIDAGRLVSGRFQATPEPAGPWKSAESSGAIWRQWRRLAVAAVLLVTISSGITAYLLRQSVPSPGPQDSGLGSASLNISTIARDEFRSAEREYLRVTEELLAALEARRDELSPETLRLVQANLVLMDQAIQETRTALELDPSNGRLVNRLSGIYRKQVDFLVQMNRL